MGIQKSGIIGPFRNKIGPVYGRRHRGQDLILPLPRITTKKATDNQLETRYLFGKLNTFLSTIHSLVNPGFKAFVKNNSPVNAAFSYNYDHALVKVGEEYQFNYPKLVYSRGHVVTPDGAQVSSGNGQVTFTWEHQNQSAYCQYADLASFMVYNPAKDDYLVLHKTVNRRAQSFTLNMPAHHPGDLVHCYMSFASADGKRQGDSWYVGQVVVVG
ncbi:MAG: hypothetical protein EOP51_29975 [Sphingobacteriales bacterium]|nr:MAG: hypothetical protein EOP51_29975 [Sphingobacteriales bacterium]